MQTTLFSPLFASTIGSSKLRESQILKIDKLRNDFRTFISINKWRFEIALFYLYIYYTER